MRAASASRHALGSAALLSESEAVALLPVRDSTARAWLRARGLVRDVPGLGELVCWGDVVDEVRLGRGPVDEEPAPRARLQRAGVAPRSRR